MGRANDGRKIGVLVSGKDKILGIRVDKETYSRLEALAGAKKAKVSTVAREALMDGMEPQIFGESLSRVEALLEERIEKSMDRYMQIFFKRFLNIEMMSAQAMYANIDLWSQAFDMPKSDVQAIFREHATTARRHVRLEADKVRIINFGSFSDVDDFTDEFADTDPATYGSDII